MLLLILPALAYLLIGAHLLFHGAGLAVLISVAAVLCLFIPRRIVSLVHVLLLILCAAEWVRAGAELVMRRIDLGQPYLLAGCILGACALFTLLTALVFRSRRLKNFYRRAPGQAGQV